MAPDQHLTLAAGPKHPPHECNRQHPKSALNVHRASGNCENRPNITDRLPNDHPCENKKRKQVSIAEPQEQQLQQKKTKKEAWKEKKTPHFDSRTTQVYAMDEMGSTEVALDDDAKEKLGGSSRHRRSYCRLDSSYAPGTHAVPEPLNTSFDDENHSLYRWDRAAVGDGEYLFEDADEGF